MDALLLRLWKAYRVADGELSLMDTVAIQALLRSYAERACTDEEFAVRWGSDTQDYIAAQLLGTRLRGGDATE